MKIQERILSIFFVVACLGLTGPGPVAGARSRISVGSPIEGFYPDQDLVEDLSAFITSQMHAAEVPGLSIALIRKGEIIWVEGFGVTNSLTGKPVTRDTVFDAASISKVVSAYAALALVERGALSLDEPVHHYLSKPWLPASPYAEQITLRHLLTHTSGLSNNVNPVYKSILYPPGERYEYSGVGFLYLQQVMEQATGKPIEQIAQELVFEPLEMDSSSYVTPSNMMSRLANGHINYGTFLLQMVVILAVGFTLTILAWLIIQRVRLGRFTLSGKMLWISYLIAASLTLASVVYLVDNGVNKWVTLVALWLILFGGGMALLLFAGRNLIARLPGKWQRPQFRVPLQGFWFFISALALLLFNNSLSGPVPRSPAGLPSAAYSMRTTASDLAKFLLELTSPQHLDQALVTEMTSPQVNSQKDQSWGLGIGINHSQQDNILFHSGNNLDFHALMLINQEQMDGLVILTNGEHGGPLVDEIANYALDKMSGQE